MATVLLPFTFCWAQADDPAQLFPVDPVALLRDGREAAGRDDVSVTRFGFRYTFTTPENKAAFEREPERFEIQQGGACARMGPLSGTGRVDLFVVHDGKLYLCASEQCRQGFLADPASLLESDDPVPECTPESAKRGRELVEKAVHAFGGATRVDALKSYRTRRIDNTGGVEQSTADTTLFPDSFSQKIDWGSGWWNLTLSPAGAWSLTTTRSDELAPQQRRAFERSRYRDPFVLMRARSQPGFVCCAAGEGEANGTAAERLFVAYAGATSELLVDPESGRVLAVGYRGRGPTSRMGRIDIDYADFEAVGGVNLPRTMNTRFDGRPFPGMSGTMDAIEVDVEVDPTTFVPARSK